MLAIPLVARDTPDALSLLPRAEAQADLVELRLDLMAAPNVEALLAARHKPVIATCRSRDEGGAFAGTDDERRALLSRAVAAGADYVDVELATLQRGPFDRGLARLIVSFHDTRGCPEDLPGIVRRLWAAGADVAKIVVAARDILDTLKVFEVLRNASGPTIALAMGEAGVVTRILAPRFGAFLTFAALEAGAESAPGQLTARELREVYRYSRIGRDTGIYGVVANPVRHSLSPRLHNAAFEALGMDKVYVPFLVSHLASFLEGFESLGVKGYSVTIPHKTEAVKLVDEYDEDVRTMGALNTIVVRDGRRYGANTDCPAAMEALDRACAGRGGLSGKKAIVLGAGGTTRAVLYGLKTRGAFTAVLNRTVAKAEALGSEFGCCAGPLSSLKNIDFDVLINTTSVGMFPDVDDIPIDPDLIEARHVVFDAVYNPLETRLIAEARRRGATVVPGIEMFVGQAAHQFRLWTGVEPPRDIMARIVREALAPPEQ